EPNHWRATAQTGPYRSEVQPPQESTRPTGLATGEEVAQALQGLLGQTLQSLIELRRHALLLAVLYLQRGQLVTDLIEAVLILFTLLLQHGLAPAGRGWRSSRRGLTGRRRRQRNRTG